MHHGKFYCMEYLLPAACFIGIFNLRTSETSIQWMWGRWGDHNIDLSPKANMNTTIKSWIPATTLHSSSVVLSSHWIQFCTTDCKSQRTPNVHVGRDWFYWLILSKSLVVYDFMKAQAENAWVNSQNLYCFQTFEKCLFSKHNNVRHQHAESYKRINNEKSNKIKFKKNTSTL